MSWETSVELGKMCSAFEDVSKKRITRFPPRSDGNVQLRASSADERALWVSSLLDMQAQHRTAKPGDPRPPEVDGTPTNVDLQNATAADGADLTTAGASDVPPPPNFVPDDKRKLCGQCAVS